MKFTTSLLILGLLCFGQTLFAQDYADAKVHWGPEQTTSKSSYLKVIGTYREFTYTLWTIKNSFEIRKLNHKQEVVNSVLVPMKKDGKSMNGQFTIMFGGQIRMFSSFVNKKTKKNYLLLRSFDPDGLSMDGEMKSVGHIPLAGKKMGLSILNTSNYRTEGDFSFRLSRDEKKLLIFYASPLAKEGFEGFTFQVFNKDFEQDWKKEVELPYANELFSVSRIRLDNEGNTHISGKVYQEPREARRGSKAFTYRIISWYEEGERVADYKVALTGKFITDLQFAFTDDGTLICAGFFSKEGTYSIRGTYYLRIDPESQRVISRSIKEFDFEFMTEFLTERQQKKAAKKEAKGKEIELYQYDLDDIILRDDGGAILVGEQYFVKVVTTTTTNSNGTTSTRTTYHYYYNDLIVVNIDPRGEIEWNLRIPKYQHSVNDGGRYSSYHLSVINNNIQFLFYEDDDNFDQKPGEKPARSSTYESLALVVVQSSGEYEKIKLIDKEEITYRLMPKEFYSLNDQEIFLYSKYRKKYQLGRLVFEE